MLRGPVRFRNVIRALAVLGGIIPAVASAGPPQEIPVGVVSDEGPDREGRQPQVAVDAGGRIHVVFGRGNTVRLAVSTDRGQTYRVGTVGSVDTLALGMRRGPRVAVTAQ